MITFTKEQLIASAHARIEFAEMMLAGELEPLKERTWSIELELARIALASLEAEIHSYTFEDDPRPLYTAQPAPIEAEPVAYMWDSDRKDVDAPGYYRPEHKIFAESSVKRYGGKVVALYAAPPAPVSVPDEMAATFIAAIENEQDRLFGQDYLMDSKDCIDVIREEVTRIKASRGAMLQGADGNCPVIPDGWKLVPVEPTSEMQSAAAGAIRFDTTPINKLWTGNAVYKAMLAAAPQQEVKS